MIRIATRSSALALAQAGQVADALGGGELVEVSSDGEAGDKARFVRGVERALLDGEADIGVHSAKDLPGEMAEGLVIAAVPVREEAADVWIGVGGSLDEVPEGARVGTASLRRRAQLLALRPDLELVELRGNVDTRLRKLAEGEVDAVVLAAAGLRRLRREDEVAFPIPAEAMTPAAGQGALVLQARSGDEAAQEAASAIGDETALRELTAERAVVALLEATCATPIGVRARVEGDGSPKRVGAEGEPRGRAAARPRPKSRAGAAGEARPRASAGDAGAGRRAASQAFTVEAFVGLPDGSEWIRDRVEGDAADPAVAGTLLAERLLAAGAREILDRAESMA